MLDTLTSVRADTANADAETEIRFSELTQAITLNGAVRRSRRKFEAARDAATRTALLSPLMFMAACASGDGGGGGGAQGPSTVAPPPGDTTPDTLAGRPLSVDAAAGLLANVQAPAGVTPQVTNISVANGAAGAVGQPLTSPLGALTVAADGSYTFTPANNATVTALGEGVTATQNFTYTIQSGGTTFQPATLTITITGTNDAPVAAAPAPVAASSSAPVSLGITVPTDPDINANGQPDPLTVSSIVLRQNGTVNASLASAFRILPDGQAPLQGGQETPGTPLSLANLPSVNQLDNIVFDPANLPAGTYSFEYTVRDSGGRSVRQTVTITLTNAAPVLVADPVAVVEDGTAVTGTVLANDRDPEGRALSVTSVSRGVDSQAVAAGSPTVIAGSFGALTLNADGSYSFAVDNALGTVQALRAGQTLSDTFTYSARDTNGGTSTAQIAVTITGVNDAPRFTGNQAFNILQGRFDVARIAATDIDGDTLTYSIVGGADAGRFFLDDLSGQLSFQGVTSVANPGDADGNNVYDIIVGITDGTTTVTRPLSITVSLNGAPEPPVANDATASITEDAAPNTVSGLLTASDPNNDPLTYARQGNGAGVYGQLIVNPNGTFTYTLDNGDTDTNSLGAGQTATDQFTYQVDDGSGQPPATAQVRITVTGANDAPVIAPTRAVTVNSGTTAVTAAGNGTDPDSNATLTYAITGADAALFTVNAQTGALAFRATPNIANPQDQGADNVYNLTLTVTDGSLSAAQAVEITVITDNFPPVFGNEAEIFVDENTVGAITILSVTDADNDPITFGALGGADAARFQLNAVTGALSFITPPDFETPADANGDNIYEVTATASDGQATATQTLLITVGDVVEAPNNNPPSLSLNASAFATPDGPGQFIYLEEQDPASRPILTASGQDPDNDVLQFTLTGADASLFTIDPNTGVLRFVDSQDFEAPANDADGDRAYDVTVNVSDGRGGLASEAVRIVLGDVAENIPPVAAPISAAIDENDRSRANGDEPDTISGNVFSAVTDPEVANGDQTLTVTGYRAAGGADVGNNISVAGQYGTLSINRTTGAYEYRLNNANASVDALSLGQTLTDSFDYTVSDGIAPSTSQITVTINGRDDVQAVVAQDDIVTVLLKEDAIDDAIIFNGGAGLADAFANDLTLTLGATFELVGLRLLQYGQDFTPVEFALPDLSDPLVSANNISPARDPDNPDSPVPGTTAIYGRFINLFTLITEDESAEIIPVSTNPDDPLDFTFSLSIIISLNENDPGFDDSGVFSIVLEYDISEIKTEDFGSKIFEAPSGYNGNPNTPGYRQIIPDIDFAKDDPDNPDSFDTGRLIFNFILPSSPDIPTVEADKALTATFNSPSPLALAIAAPQDDDPIPASGAYPDGRLPVLVNGVPSAGILTVGNSIQRDGNGNITNDVGLGADQIIGLDIAQLRNLFWHPVGADGTTPLPAGSYESFTYEFRDEGGTPTADRLGDATNGIQSQVIALSIPNPVITLSASTARLLTPGAGTNSNADNNTAFLRSGGQSSGGAGFGSALAVGDVTGDGALELLIGAPGAAVRGNNNNAGAIGSVSLGALLLPTGSQTINSRLFSGQPGERLGTSIAAGNVLGDSRSDVIIGAPGAATGAAGNAYVVAGGATLAGAGSGTGTQALNSTNLNGTNGFVVTPSTANGNTNAGLGTSVAFVGNIQGTGGNGEFLVNAPGDDFYRSYNGNNNGVSDGAVPPLVVAGTNVGNAYVIDGNNNFSATNAVDALKSISSGEAGSNGVGYSLGTANGGGFSAAVSGDFGPNNLDFGIRIIALGSPTQGRVAILDNAGAPATTAEPNVDSASIDGPLILETRTASDQLGASLALVHASGYVFETTSRTFVLDGNLTTFDLLIGAPGRDLSAGATDNSGAAFLILGQDALPQDGIRSLDDAQLNLRIVEIRSGLANSQFGTAVANIGDFNGDNVDDFAIGAPGENSNAGAVYVVFGKALNDDWFASDPNQNRATLTLDNSNLGVDYIRIAGPAGSRTGTAVVGIGDRQTTINGVTATDGFDDIAIGAPNSGTINGAVYVVNGYLIGQVQDPDVAQNGAPPPQFSASVSVIDADGQVDALLAATLGEGAPAPLDAGVFAPEFGADFDKAQLLAFAPLHADGMILHIA